MQVRDWGRADWAATDAAMRAYTAARTPESADWLWLVEHPPVYTQGIAGRAEHLLAPGDIPVVQSDRGGQVTYHGPGQVVAYLLLDLRRLGIHVKEYVYRLETAIIQTLDAFGLAGFRVPGAPGVYVNRFEPAAGRLPTGPLPPGGVAALPGVAKIAALGVKVSHHCTYHGLALNVAMDLGPYLRINPCGYAGLVTTDMASLGAAADLPAVRAVLTERLTQHLSP